MIFGFQWHFRLIRLMLWHFEKKMLLCISRKFYEIYGISRNFPYLFLFLLAKYDFFSLLHRKYIVSLMNEIWYYATLIKTNIVLENLIWKHKSMSTAKQMTHIDNQCIWKSHFIYKVKKLHLNTQFIWWREYGLKKKHWSLSLSSQ